MTDEAIIDEVRGILAATTEALTRAEIVEQTEAAEPQDVASALHQLVKDDEVHVADDTSRGKTRYRVGPDPDAGNADTAAPANEGKRTGLDDGPALKRVNLTDQVRMVVRQADEPRTTREIAEALGRKPRDISMAMNGLVKRGEVVGERITGSPAKYYRFTGANPPDPTRSKVAELSGSAQQHTPERAADAQEAESARDDVPGPAGDTDETPSPEGQAHAVYALRSNKHMEIRKGDQSIELAPEEVADLMRYLEPWMMHKLAEAS